MIGLKDIAPSTETVTIRGKAINITGVSVKGIAYLLNRFPEFRHAIQNRKFEVNPEKLFELVPNAIAAVIACGTGSAGDPDAEAIAERLSAAEQLSLLEAIIRVTMPGGVRPFVETLRGLTSDFKGLEDDITMAPATKSPQQSKS